MNIRDFLILLFLLFPTLANAQQSWDWLIAGGTIVDGTGAPAYKADVLIRGNSIGYIGHVDADTIQVAHKMDATGQIVTPGFIDMHAHGNPLYTPEFRNFLGMGVTTIVLGQDGSSPTDGSFEKWFEKVAKVQPAVNIATLAGHGTIRRKAGARQSSANEQQLKRMAELLKAAMQAGAFGMSTGLEYVPGLYADKEELVQMAMVVGRYDGIIMSHMRSEDDARIKESINELAAQGKYAQVHISHLKVVYGKGADRAEEVLQYINHFREQGIEITADTYPYAASYTGIGIVFPNWAKTEEQFQQALKERPEQLRQYLKMKVTKRNGPDAILIGSGKYAGKTMKEAAELESMSYIELLLKMGPNGPSAAHFVMNEVLQDRIAIAPCVMISSDGSPSMGHPRGYGAFAKVIRKYVVQRQVLSIEEAIHKMSGLSAQTMGFKKRGLIKEGYKADILVFDPKKIEARATFEYPHRLADGFNWIWVNGQLARKNGQFSEVRYGEVLKKD